MLDLPQQFDGLTKTFQSQDYPEVATIASLLHLDISKATASKSKRGVLAIYGARFTDGTQADVIATVWPRKLLNAVLHNSSTLYGELGGRTLGANQRIERSKFGTGLAVLFELNGLTCGFTASSFDSVVDSLFCEETRSAGRDGDALART